MKSKVSIIFLLLLLSTSIFAVETITQCFDTPVHLNCVDQDNELFSLEGKYDINGTAFKISARRAWHKEWCLTTLKKINHILDSSDYCVDSEVLSRDDTNLTLEKIYGSKGRWSYFE